MECFVWVHNSHSFYFCDVPEFILQIQNIILSDIDILDFENIQSHSIFKANWSCDRFIMANDL